ncbi:MAG TPA: ABC transporter ATP-binding protein [Candidatus Lustribacter sp.]|jgi:branched-chain amino acid transport system ATP-binding protein|nr:ABC transporter ATP-binding protein [Candidatus Lustribacter sp.]
MLLEVRDLYAGYGELDVLRGVSLQVEAGEMVAVLGPNGAGKSTLLRTISGLDTDVRSGSIHFDGHDLVRASTVASVRYGCLHVPEGRQLFTELSVDDNLRLGAFTAGRKNVSSELATVYERFPALAERKGQTAFSLSGGEQQMLAIGRALMARPRMLMLDEPSTGLAPQIVEAIFAILTGLKRSGTAVLIVEQNAYLTLRHADRACVLEHGAIALSGTAAGLQADSMVRSIYLGGSTEA